MNRCIEAWIRGGCPRFRIASRSLGSTPKGDIWSCAASFRTFSNAASQPGEFVMFGYVDVRDDD